MQQNTRYTHLSYLFILIKGILSTFSLRSTLAATVFATLLGGDWWSAAERLGAGGTENCYSLANMLKSSQPSDEDPRARYPSLTAGLQGQVAQGTKQQLSFLPIGARHFV